MKSAAFLLLLLSAACRATESPRPDATSSGKPFARRLPGVENLAQIGPTLYRGAQPDAAGLEHLRALGVATVISLRSYHSDREEVEAAGMSCVRIPLQADVFGSEPPTDEQLALFFSIALDPTQQPVFFHCAHGKDRTGLFAALWRIEIDGWTNAEALEELQAFGYHDIYRDLIDYVRDYRPRGFGKDALDPSRG